MSIVFGFMLQKVIKSSLTEHCKGQSCMPEIHKTSCHVMESKKTSNSNHKQNHSKTVGFSFLPQDPGTHRELQNLQIEFQMDPPQECQWAKTIVCYSAPSDPSVRIFPRALCTLRQSITKKNPHPPKKGGRKRKEIQPPNLKQSIAETQHYTNNQTVR